MERQEFIGLYNISEERPQNPHLVIMSADGFSDAIVEFINDKFRGIAHASRQRISSSSIFSSPEYTAFMLKTLLCEIYGRVFLEITFSESSDHLEIIIEAEEDLPIADNELRRIIRLARNAGMDIYPDRRRLRLTMSFSEAAARKVYAVSLHDSRNIMLGKLHEIILLPEIHVSKKESRPMPQAAGFEPPY